MDSSLQTGIALDVGERRIGVARANLVVRLASPLTTLSTPESFIDDIIRLVRDEAAAWIVLGLPRGLQGQDTAQTQAVRDFALRLAAGLQAAHLPLPLYWTDEALTSEQAEAELRGRRGKSSARTQKTDIDALAATYILEDFLASHADVDGAAHV